MAKVTIRKKGKKPISFNKGALHRALGVPEGQPIPSGKKKAALKSKNPKIRKMASFGFKGPLAKGRKTAAKNRKKGK